MSASLAAILALIEKHGTTVFPARSLEKIASVDARAALHTAKIITAAPAAISWPCDVRGCSREIRANYDGARRPLVAVCSQAPGACEAVELGFEDVAQQELSVAALLRAVCVLFEIDVDRAALAKVREPRAIGEARAVIAVGAAGKRDVFWAGAPRDTDLGAFCGRRERVTRGTLVLVPTGKHVTLDVASRYGRGEHVEVLALADAIEVREGKLLLVEDGGERVFTTTAPPPPDAPEPSGSLPKKRGRAPASAGHGLAALLGVTKWEQLRITVIDGHTVRIEGNAKHVLRTFVELGFVDARKRDVVAPVKAWSVFVLVCKTGRFRPSEYGELGAKWAAKKGIEMMRVALCAAFGVAADPMRKYSRAAGWVPRFRIGAARESGPPADRLREKVLELKAELAPKPKNPKPKVTKTQKAVAKAAKSTANKVRKAKEVLAAHSPIASAPAAPPPEEHPAPNGVAPAAPAPH